MTERLLETVAAVLETHAVRGRRVAVGLSGGVDSVVLLDVLGRLRNDLRLALSAIHVNHQISPHTRAPVSSETMASELFLFTQCPVPPIRGRTRELLKSVPQSICPQSVIDRKTREIGVRQGASP